MAPGLEHRNVSPNKELKQLALALPYQTWTRDAETVHPVDDEIKMELINLGIYRQNPPCGPLPVLH